MYQIFRNCQCLNDLQVRIYDLATSTTWHSNGVPQMYSSWNGIKISQILSLLFDFVVVLLFYVHGKHLRSCRDGQLT